jgi:hypothetical protein
LVGPPGFGTSAISTSRSALSSTVCCSLRFPAPTDLTDQALISAGWQQVVAQFDAGVTRQHRH